MKKQPGTCRNGSFATRVNVALKSGQMLTLFVHGPDQVLYKGQISRTWARFWPFIKRVTSTVDVAGSEYTPLEMAGTVAIQHEMVLP